MPRSIDTVIEIAASPQRVWDVLGDFARYPEWNRFLLRVEGRLAVSAQIRFRFELPRGLRMNATAAVLKLAPSRELRWAGCFLWPWLFRAEHYFVIERIERERIRFLHGEIFSGLLLPFAWLILRGLGPPVYAQMNADLKQRCERIPPDHNRRARHEGAQPRPPRPLAGEGDAVSLRDVTLRRPPCPDSLPQSRN